MRDAMLIRYNLRPFCPSVRSFVRHSQGSAVNSKHRNAGNTEYIKPRLKTREDARGFVARLVS